jgi:hypothetical protein
MTTTSLLPATHDLALYDGDGHVLEYEIVDGSSVALNVSAYTWTAQWRVSRSAVAKVDLEVDVSDAATGIIRVEWTAAIMAAIGSKGVWDLQGQLPSSDPLTPVTGKVAKTKDVTRP